ncbi:small subunit processome component 20 homolog [Neocloeon triangulifer]|uniref:small subunit processome component 20 homolog n=1 Tax=Neocloeon triangulifer TaxID=2078957 RepID=UPI00286F2B62|nr:small subunit processome component 20 homolog [Neocloeon triangulifer]
MKNKPNRHKEENVFRFQSFTERIACLKVDVFHQVQAFDTDAEEGETHLQNAIDKWNVQNGTEAFEKCLRQLPDCRSLAQILLNKEKIVQILFEHINQQDPLALQGLLELLVALARDMRHEFYPHFSDTLSLIFNLITTSRDADVLEWSFQSMAYLLKFLWRSLLKEPTGIVFKHVLPLLEDSRPVYIQEFASQCFAFVARKVRDKESFVKAIIDKLDREEDGIEGTGILVAESIYGASGYFHSGAEPFLQLLISFLASQELNCQILQQVLTSAIKRLIFKVKKENFAPFWNTIPVVLVEFVTKSEYKAVTRLLEILQVVSETKGGFFFQTAPILSALKQLVSREDVPEQTLQAISDLVAEILCSPAQKLSQEETATLTSQVLSIKHKAIFLNFISKVINCSGFEAHVLQKLAKFCKETSDVQDFPKLLLLLAKIIEVKAPPCHSGLELQNWKQYPLGIQKSQFTEFLLQQLDEGDLDKIMPAIVLLPHMYCIDRKLMQQKLEGIIERTGKHSENVFIFGLAVEAAVHLMLTSELDKEVLINFAIENKDKLAALRMLDIYITAVNSRDQNVFNKLMEANYHHILSSPYHKNRVLASHTLSLLEPEESKIFTMCLQAENTPATITDYRDRVKELQGLEFKYIHDMNEFSANVALRFLIGNLYVNFKLVWDPVTSIIVSHASCQDSHKFWEIFGEQLKLACQRCNNNESVEICLPECDQFVSDLYGSLEGQLDTPDHANFRRLLWNAMTFFPEVCEARNRDISSLFLDFLQNEFFNNDVSDANFWNVAKDKNEEKMDIDDPTEPAEEEPEEEEGEENETETQTIKRSKTRPTLNLLLAHLELLAKLRNPRGMFRESELHDAYQELLKMKNSKVQKLALDCIMAYKFNYLVPYKDQLYGLVGEKEFKDQLVAFNIGTDSDVVLLEHRPQLIPVVMRIVFSKMQSKTKIKGSSKRSLILRFLGGCRQEELLIFLGLAFKLVLANCKEDEPFDAMVLRIMDSVDLKRMVPPKRLSSALNLANTVLSQLGRRDEGMALCSQTLLKIQLVVAAQVAGVLRRKEEVAKTAVSAYRSTRKQAIDSFSKFFSRDYQGDASSVYRWSAHEIDAVFEAVVWPSIDVLHVESVAYPTALLKLFGVWAGNTRYFNLLVKHRVGCEMSNPLAAMIKLLNAEAVKGQVVAAILESLTNLLTLRPATDEEEEEMDAGTAAAEIENVTNVLPVDEAYLEKIQTPGLQLNYGSKLILPHVADLLNYLHKRVSLASTKLKAKGGLSDRDLVILARVSELVYDPELSLSLLRLVLPLAAKKASLGTGDRTLEPLLSTASFLLRRIDNPRQFTLQIAPLFGSVQGRASRDRLSQIVFSRVINLIDEEEAKVVCDLNSWDGRHIDEPDFEKRINSFTQIKNMDQASVPFFLMVIHSSFHTLKAVKDLSLKDCASLCLQTVCPKLAKRFANDPENRTIVMERTTMEIIRKGLRDKNEELQHELLCLLGVMVRECGQLHPTLRDLQPLACAEDVELDFFENIRHLQVHRRARALMRFTNTVKENGVVMKTTTLTQIILPLASSFLCVEKYAKINSLVDAAIDALSTVCSMLPWAEYETVLRFNLNRLPRMFDYQKQLVRTVIAVLDAYHFDLSVLEKKPVEPAVTAVELKGKDLDDEEEPQDEEELAEVLEKVTEKKEEAVKCTVTEANKIRSTILFQLLPKLQNTVSAKSATDSLHKVNKNTGDVAEEREREAREVLRVPIALAIVKLLQKLPGDALKQNLTGVLLKVCIFLRSRLESTRRAARETLQQMLRILGTKFLNKMLSELCSLLTRGYLVHVLIYTVHSLIVGIGDIIQAGDIDACLQNILKVCMTDLFGCAAEEKEIAQIAGKTSEARSHKSFDTLHLAAKYVSEKSVTDILIPIKNELASSHSYKVLKKANNCLQQIVQGLAENTFISAESLMTFAFGTASESIPALQSAIKANNKQKEKLTAAQKAIQRPDTFLITPAPKRSGPTVTKNVDTHAHLFIAFGLQLLHFLLKRERTKEIPDEMLDPFVAILAKSLNSQHNKLTVLSLQCLAWLLKLELPSLKENIETIADNIFKILHKYSGSAQGKGDNFDMANAAFKAVGVLVREVEYHNIRKEQVRLLLLYAERDIQADSSRQATAFTLLKAILRRRLSSPDMQQVMRTVAELSITSPMNHVRQQARQVFLFYMSEYQSGKHFENQLTFMLSQLNFELQTGRMSALDTLSALINNMPHQRLSSVCSLIFISMSASLINDEDPECRQLAAKILKSMLQRLEPKSRELLFSIVVAWLQDKKMAHRRLAAQVCGLFVALEGEKFAQRLPIILPLVYSCLCPVSKIGRFVRAPKEQEEVEDEDTNSGGSIEDHLLYQALQLLVKISGHCPNWLRNAKIEESVSDICLEMTRLLCHSHEWVRLGACQFIGCIFAALDAAAIAEAVANRKEEAPDLLIFKLNPELVLKSLVLDLCDLLQPGDLQPQLAEQVVKNLVYLARVLKHIPKDYAVSFDDDDEEEEDGEKKHQPKLSLVWMAKRMRKIVNLEIAKAPKSGTLRDSVLKWTTAVIIDLGPEALLKNPMLMHHMLAPVVREITITNENNPHAPHGLRKLAKEVANIIKGQIGVEAFALATSKLNAKFSEHKATRKRKIAQQAITDPELAAKRRIKKQAMKKVLKKKKINSLRGRVRKDHRLHQDEEMDV